MKKLSDSKGVFTDFLSLMLNDELFADKDDFLIDECLTFMLAATMTTTLLISNAIYYLTQNEDKLTILR
jgi:cytochrome P450